MNTKKTDKNDHGIQTRLRDAHRENLVEKPDIRADAHVIEDKEANVQNNSEEGKGEAIEKTVINSENQNRKRKETSPTIENGKCTTKTEPSTQQKHRIYRINHTTRTESDLDIRPFTIDQMVQKKPL